MEHSRLEQVAEGAWASLAVEGGGAVGNAGIVAIEGRSLVFDAHVTPAAARDLRSAAEELVGPVWKLVNSHSHFDHWGGNQAFADVPIVSTERTRELIATDGPKRVEGFRSGLADYLREQEEKLAVEEDARKRRELELDLASDRFVASELPTLEVVVPTETFAERLELGRAELLTYGGGHTPSDAVLWLPAERVLFAADLVVIGSHANLSPGDPDEWLRILARLEALRPAVVVPGHGPVGGPEAIGAVAAYIGETQRLAAEPGEPEMPAAWAGYAFSEVFQANIAFLRERAPV